MPSDSIKKWAIWGLVLPAAIAIGLILMAIVVVQGVGPLFADTYPAGVQTLSEFERYIFFNATLHLVITAVIIFCFLTFRTKYNGIGLRLVFL